MSPSEMNNKFRNMIYALLDMQGHAPTGEMNDELRQIRSNMVNLNVKLLDYIFDHRNKSI